MNILSERTINAYNRRAKDYESRWKKYLAHTHQALLQHIRTDAGDVVLDVSGGTGLLTQRMIDQNYPFKHLVINDPSDQMLAVARKRLSGHPKISFDNYRVEQLPYQKNYFDRIICLNSFHYYVDQRSVLNRFYKILSPGGKLFLLDWNRSGFFSIVNQCIAWWSSEIINSRSLAELRKMLPRSGFEIHGLDEWNWRYWKFLFIEGYKSRRK